MGTGMVCFSIGISDIACVWYRAAYMSSPTHIEIMLSEKAEGVKKEEAPVKLSRKRLAQLRVRVGGGN